MKKPTRFSVAMLISAATLWAAVSAPAVFAEEGHGGPGGRGSDDVVTTATPVVDNDVNDDHGVDAAVTTTAGPPMVGVEDRHAAAEDNDEPHRRLIVFNPRVLHVPAGLHGPAGTSAVSS